MYFSGRSNCLIQAWKAFSSGEATHVAFRLTTHRFSCKNAHLWWWVWTLGVVGTILQWIGHSTWVIGCVLRWGKPIHSQWRLPDGTWMEYVPKDVDFYDRPGTMPMSISFEGIKRKCEELN